MESERIIIRATDVVNRIDMNIELPEHSKKELEELKSDIKENGVKVPILVKESSDSHKLIDGMHCLQICRELGIDCPAILLDVDDVRAREIALEENLGRRTMTQKQKKIILKRINSSQKEIKVTKETFRPDFVEDSSVGRSRNQAHFG